MHLGGTDELGGTDDLWLQNLWILLFLKDDTDGKSPCSYKLLFL